MRPRSILSSLAVLLMMGSDGVLGQPSFLDLPKAFKVTTSRNVASKIHSRLDIDRRQSKGLDQETVELHVTIYHQQELDFLEELHISNLLRYEEHSVQRHLQDAVQTTTFEELGCYRTLKQLYADMDALVEKYPGFVAIETIGESWWKQQGLRKGNDIKVIKITAPNSTVKVRQKNNVIVVAGQHSRELPPPETVLQWGEYMLENYGMDADVSWVLNRTAIHIIPIANPDGRSLVEKTLNWDYRKNAHPYGCSVEEQDGVDLNRNYPLFWGNDTGSSGDPCSNDFRGGAPLSEPESSAIYQYASAIFPATQKRGTTAEEALLVIDEQCSNEATGIFIDVHSQGNFVSFPWAKSNTPSPNHKSLLTMAAKLANPGNYTLWGPGQEGYLYDVSGHAADSLYGIDCVASFGFEIGTSRQASCEELNESIIPIMKQSLLYAAKAASAPYTIPLGPDIMKIEYNTNDSANTELLVEVSHVDLIVPQAIFDEEVTRGDQIFSVQVFLDLHPADANSVGKLMTARDGLFASVSEVATYSLDTTGLEGRHTLYFVATDRNGHDGPVSAVYIEYPITTTTTFVDEDLPPVLGAEEAPNTAPTNVTGTQSEGTTVNEEDEVSPTASPMTNSSSPSIGFAWAFATVVLAASLAF